MQTNKFTCLIEDPIMKDRFSAQVFVQKRVPIRTSREGRHLELADVFITPVSGQHFLYESANNWDKSPAKFNVPTREKSGSHNHFVIFDHNGWGLYIVRDSKRNEVQRRECSIWSLGDAFGTKVMKILREFS